MERRVGGRKTGGSPKSKSWGAPGSVRSFQGFQNFFAASCVAAEGAEAGLRPYSLPGAFHGADRFSLTQVQTYDALGSNHILRFGS